MTNSNLLVWISYYINTFNYLGDIIIDCFVIHLFNSTDSSLLLVQITICERFIYYCTKIWIIISNLEYLYYF